MSGGFNDRWLCGVAWVPVEASISLFGTSIIRVCFNIPLSDGEVSVCLCVGVCVCLCVNISHFVLEAPTVAFMWPKGHSGAQFGPWGVDL